MTAAEVAAALQLACAGQRVREDAALLRALLAEALRALGAHVAPVVVGAHRFEVRASGESQRAVADAPVGIVQAEALWRIHGVRAVCYDRWTDREVAAFPDDYHAPSDAHTLGHA